eukprot:190898-Rhodomonas_salina.1
MECQEALSDAGVQGSTRALHRALCLSALFYVQMLCAVCLAPSLASDIVKHFHCQPTLGLAPASSAAGRRVCLSETGGQQVGTASHARSAHTFTVRCSVLIWCFAPPGQIHAEEMPQHLSLEVHRNFNLEKQEWVGGTVENPTQFWGKCGPPPLPEAVPPLIELALGRRVNAPINDKVALAWVEMTDARLQATMKAEQEEEDELPS